MATIKPISIQESFLNQARKENILVTIHLMNGFQIKGFIRGFDNFTVIVDSMGRQQLIYKHAISTISPSKPLPKPVRSIEEGVIEDDEPAPASAAD